jgi:hypothetical protein
MSEHESWDQFWSEVTAKARTEVIRGVEVRVPTDIPLAVERRMEELSDSSALEDVADLVSRIFGADVLEQWIDAGMGSTEFKTVVAWGMAQGDGQDISFREAYERVRAADEGKAPAAPNRAARRAASKTPSAATGGPSKRTSSASTASTHKVSRA